MSYRIRVSETDIAFPCASDETVLDAAERAGFAIPYSCRKGVCNTCEGQLVIGELTLPGKGLVQGNSDAILMCRAQPRSDLEILPKRIERREPPVRKIVRATLFRLARPAPGVSILTFRFSIGLRAKFKAGQYLQILLSDGDRRNFSIANAPQGNDGVELHIRHIPGGRFSEQVLSNVKMGDKFDMELPYGDFFVRQDSRTKIILLATGTGFAPIKSIVEDALKRGEERQMRLYWGARRREDLYLLDLPQKWVDQASWFSFIPVLSEPDGEWQGRTGHVHQAAMADYSDLSDIQVYACGSPLMIAAAQDGFIRYRGLPKQHFYSDAFVQSGESERRKQVVEAKQQVSK